MSREPLALKPVLLQGFGAIGFSILIFVAWCAYDIYTNGWVRVPMCMQLTINSGKIKRSKSTPVVAKIINESAYFSSPYPTFDMMHVRGKKISVTWSGPTNPTLFVCQNGTYDEWKLAVLFFESKLTESFIVTRAHLQLDSKRFPNHSPSQFDVANPVNFNQLESTVFNRSVMP